jgi:hypothetical protein
MQKREISMPVPQPATSPLARLVFFIVILAVAGVLLAGIHYATIDLPAQQAMEDYTRCSGGCISTNVFISTPTGPHNPTDEACQKECREKYLHR